MCIANLTMIILMLERVMMYRPTKSVEQMMEEVLEDVMEHSLVNSMFKEVVDTGPSAVLSWSIKWLREG